MKELDSPNHSLRTVFLIATLTLVILLQFRVQILNHFTVLYGDRYDAVITAVILEHWFSVARGFSQWSELNYFFPYKDTLAQTDGYFLIGLIYALFRATGIDLFLSTELSNVTIRAIGFLAFFLAGRTIFKLPFSWAIVAASLFILSNNATVHGQRIQLATVGFSPIVALLIWHAFEALQAGRTARLTILGSLAGIFLGAWALTCFYMTWFFLFFGINLLIALSISAGLPRLKKIVRAVAREKFSLLIVVTVTVLSFVPMLSIYLPKAAETGVRPYATVIGNTVLPEGVLQVGTENLLFGRLYASLLKVLSPGYEIKGEYYNTGIAPIVFFLFIVGLFAVFKNRENVDRLFLRALGVATIFTWALTLNVLGFSAWTIVYHLIPGAKALSVVSAFQLFLVQPVIILAVTWLASVAPKTPTPILVLIVALLYVEELNTGYNSLVRQDELNRVALTDPPPKQCSAFFVTAWPDQMSRSINAYYAHNVTAMLIAELVRVPTINGIASFNPPDWDFGFPDSPDYIDRIKKYATAHKIEGLCKLTLDNKKWDTNWRSGTE